jgi:hypothetical protein
MKFRKNQYFFFRIRYGRQADREAGRYNIQKPTVLLFQQRKEADNSVFTSSKHTVCLHYKNELLNAV